MNKKPMFLYLRQKPQFHLAEGHIPHTLEGVGGPLTSVRMAHLFFNILNPVTLFAILLDLQITILPEEWPIGIVFLTINL